MTETSNKDLQAEACKCCRHSRPHCKCRLDRPLKESPKPITTKGLSGDLVEYLNLREIAYVLRSRSAQGGYTVLQISGAVRALEIKNDTTARKSVVRGAVVFRQQTMVHKAYLRAIEEYVMERFG